MPVTYDKLLDTELLHKHKGTDILVTQDGLFLVDANGIKWKLTVDTDGALITTKVLTIIDYLLQDGSQYEFQDGDDYNFKD